MTKHSFSILAVLLLAANILSAAPRLTIGGIEFSDADVEAVVEQQRFVLETRNPEAEWNQAREVASELQFILSEGARVYTSALIDEAALSPEEVTNASDQLTTAGLLVHYDRPLALRNHHLRRTLGLLPAPAERTEEILHNIYQQHIVPAPVARGYALRDWMILASDTVATSPSLTLPASREEFAALNEEGTRAMLARQKVGRQLAEAKLLDPQARSAAREALLQSGKEEVTPQQETLLIILQEAALHRRQWFTENIVVNDDIVATFWERYQEKERNTNHQARFVSEINSGLPLLVEP